MLTGKKIIAKGNFEDLYTGWPLVKGDHRKVILCLGPAPPLTHLEEAGTRLSKLG